MSTDRIAPPGGLVAAIYARKSSDQNLPDAEKSVPWQPDRAQGVAGRSGQPLRR